MKKLFIRSLLCFLMLSILLQQANAQPKSRPGKVFLYKAIITTIADHKIKAWLYDADDTQVYLVSDKTKIKSIKSLEPTMIIQADQIQKLKIRRKGSFSRAAGGGVFIGVTLGLAFAVLINSSQNDDEKLTAGSFILSAVVAGLYAGMLSIPFGLKPARKFNINGNSVAYQNAKNLIRTYSLKGQME